MISSEHARTRNPAKPQVRGEHGSSAPLAGRKPNTPNTLRPPTCTFTEHATEHATEHVRANTQGPPSLEGVLRSACSCSVKGEAGGRGIVLTAQGSGDSENRPGCIPVASWLQRYTSSQVRDPGSGFIIRSEAGQSA